VEAVAITDSAKSYHKKDLRNSATALMPWMTLALKGQPETTFVLQFGHGTDAVESVSEE
jgi:hypothetical protein